MMNGNNIWIWLVLGIIPYYVNKQPMRNGWILQIRTLFWSFEIHYQRLSQNQWTLRVPLIKRLGDAVWAAIMLIRKDDPSQE